MRKSRRKDSTNYQITYSPEFWISVNKTSNPCKDKNRQVQFFLTNISKSGKIV
jgi:hypothetical protein